MVEDKMVDAMDTVIDVIKDSFKSFANRSLNNNTAMIKEFNEGVYYKPGSKYLKIIREDDMNRSVHSFIVNTKTDKKFKYGDILKAASWNAPARNFARGNVFESVENIKKSVRWTGAV
jgi:hypothetical protein